MKFNRAICITENSQIVFRHDTQSEHALELDLFNAISRLSDKNEINIEKLINMLKCKRGLSITDKLEITKECVKVKYLHHKSNWEILPEV